jgi:hypothetical protein
LKVENILRQGRGTGDYYVGDKKEVHMRTIFSIILMILLAAGPATSLAVGSEAPDEGYEGWLKMRLAMQLPEGTVRFSMALGSILIADQPGYQPVLVTRVQVEDFKDVVDFLRPDAFAFNKETKTWSWRFLARKSVRLLVQGYCLNGTASSPSGAHSYTFSGRRMPWAQVDHLMTLANRQQAVWAAVDTRLNMGRL